MRSVALLSGLVLLTLVACGDDPSSSSEIPLTPAAGASGNAGAGPGGSGGAGIAGKSGGSGGSGASAGSSGGGAAGASAGEGGSSGVAGSSGEAGAGGAGASGQGGASGEAGASGDAGAGGEAGASGDAGAGGSSGSGGDAGNAGSGGEAGQGGTAGDGGAAGTNGGAAGDAGGGQGGVSGTSGQGGVGVGGSGVVVDVQVNPPTPPLPPTFPVLTPCPSGWTETTLTSGITGCEPGPMPSWTCPANWLPRTMLAGTPQQYDICEPPPPATGCPSGTMPVLGETSCQPVGDPCPSGDFPENLPSGKTITYVLAGAPAGGNGTKAKPFSALSSGISATPNGGIVAIGKGAYTQNVLMGAGRNLTLWGACAEAVSLQGTATSDPTQGTIQGVGSSSTRVTMAIRNLTIQGDRSGMVLQYTDADLTGVQFSKTIGWGILAHSSSVLTLSQLSFVGTRTHSNGVSRSLDLQLGAKATGSKLYWSDNQGQAVFLVGSGTVGDFTDAIVQGTKDGGLYFQEQSTLKLARGLVEGNVRGGILGVSNGTCELQDLVVRGTTWAPSIPNSGQGLYLNAATKATITRALIEGNQREGVLAWSNASGPAKRTTVDIKDMAILDTKASGSGDDGYGLYVMQNAGVTAVHLLVDGNLKGGVVAGGDEATLDATDLMVFNTKPSPSSLSSSAPGLSLYGALSKVQQALIQGNYGLGVSITGTSGTASLSDFIVRDTQPTSEGLNGEGIVAQLGAKFALSRGLLDGNRSSGFVMAKPGTSATLEDIVVQDTKEVAADGSLGRGVVVQEGASLSASRLLIDSSREIGLLTSLGDAKVTLTDLIVQNTQGRASDDRLGNGIFCGESSQMTVERARITNNRNSGVLASGLGAVLKLSDIEVQGTLEQKLDGIMGRGVGCQFKASLSIERALLEANRESGIGMIGCGDDVIVRDVKILNTKEQASDGSWGVGVLSDFSVTLLERVEGRGNRGAGVLTFGGEITLSSCTFAETKEGKFEPFQSSPVTGVADGGLFRDLAKVNASNVLLLNTARAGFVFTGSSGELSNVKAEGNVFGLVVNDGATVNNPQCACSFENNQTPVLSDGELAVPSTPPATPSFPSPAATPPPPPVL